MPIYDVDSILANGQRARDILEAQQQLADGRWTPIQRCVELDTEQGIAVVLEGEGGAPTLDRPGGSFTHRRVMGSFRMVHRETGEVNPPLAVAAAPEQPVAGAPPVQALAMVDALTVTEKQLEDGSWSASFVELAEVVGIGTTEAEARAAARAQALEIGELVAGLKG